MREPPAHGALLPPPVSTGGLVRELLQPPLQDGLGHAHGDEEALAQPHAVPPRQCVGEVSPDELLPNELPKLRYRQEPRPISSFSFIP